MTKQKYKVYVALSDDINAPYIWASEPTIPKRTLVKIINHNNWLSVVCQLINIDQNFKNRYDRSENTLKLKHITDPVVVMNGWYRTCLGIETERCADLEIRPIGRCSKWLAQIRASRSHPNYIDKLAINLAILSVILGFVGLILGIISLRK